MEEEKRYLVQSIHECPSLLKRIGEHATFPCVPLGLFGNIQTERWGIYSGQIDIKHSGYVQLLNSIKFLSLSENISKNTMLERLNELKRGLPLPLQLLEEVKSAFFNCIYLRLKYSTKNGRHDDHVHLRSLDPSDRFELKKVMKTVKKLQRFVLRKASDLQDE